MVGAVRCRYGMSRRLTQHPNFFFSSHTTYRTPQHGCYTTFHSNRPGFSVIKSGRGPSRNLVALWADSKRTAVADAPPEALSHSAPLLPSPTRCPGFVCLGARSERQLPQHPRPIRSNASSHRVAPQSEISSAGVWDDTITASLGSMSPISPAELKTIVLMGGTYRGTLTGSGSSTSSTWQLSRGVWSHRCNLRWQHLTASTIYDRRAITQNVELHITWT
ncbi:hypothetical protein B0T16DRAFT_217898 [Cercophora newfieldiana]|uniref:Uncharacterized protein n=1 Tax=Cercophora newfieldiana TaxID=92897 RepID=A0AA39XWM1_9PEZI|nr:hypothetical protein B0T16DRAFT_217898 [Cercophora newfieldiana]